MTYAKILILSAFLIVLGASPAFSQFDDQGNPPNWCRNGHFPTYSKNFQIGYVVKNRSYFYDDKEGCPEGDSCRKKAYVIRSDEVVIGKQFDNFVCAFFQSKTGVQTVGWLKASDVSMVEIHTPDFDQWVGEWKNGDNEIRISTTHKNGELKIEGNAVWVGNIETGNVHIGELNNRSKPNDNYMKISGVDEYDCQVEFQLVADYLIAKDNLKCGGINVSFSGVYTKTKAE